jgi:hypothetical protein
MVTSISKLDMGEWKEPDMVCSEISAGRNVGYEGSRPVGSSVVSVEEAVKLACRDNCDSVNLLWDCVLRFLENVCR